METLFKNMEIRNVIELSAFSKSLSKKITYLNHKERILIDIEQIAAITPTSEREDLPKKVGLASCNNDEAKEELYTCVLLKCGFSVRVIESVEEVYNKILRSKRKMETVRIRKANATIKKEKYISFSM